MQGKQKAKVVPANPQTPQPQAATSEHLSPRYTVRAPHPRRVFVFAPGVALQQEEKCSNAPIDDEPISEEEERDVAEARAQIARGEFVSMEEVLADFGLTMEDFERMGRTPLPPESDQTNAN
ncbi:hypothetical protein [Terracidiphilus sp.]|uniref:hypothetical protein n=1 Tax=Terracidiphilus sp. TaxID=1964191 RepID=UPI003C75ABD4